MNKIIYLDAAASALKPRVVVDAERDFLDHQYANAGRGVCARAGAVDQMVATTRADVAAWIHAAPRQIVFTANATDGLNRAAAMIMDAWRAAPVPTVAVSDLDHHSARLPWQQRAGAGRCHLVTMPLDAAYNIDGAQIPRADVMVVTAMSNVMGMPQDVSAIVASARRQNPDVVVIVDAAQYVAHREIDAQAWGADFICFSGHKIGADTGVGVMYVADPDRWGPTVFGGGMVNRVGADGTCIWHDAPHRFEAGTLPLTQIAGLSPAIHAWRAWGGAGPLVHLMHDRLAKMPGMRLITGPDASVVTFVPGNMHVLDFGARAGARDVCLRVGNMCASWMMRALNIDGAVRLSVGPWNDTDDVTRAMDIIEKIMA
ncbi:aminotransferase class V-fold PLP-dependent enzyme [bacterium]|nr:aminotransferase class V-fold PLP-dependent enzyme [bacterium]